MNMTIFSYYTWWPVSNVINSRKLFFEIFQQKSLILFWSFCFLFDIYICFLYETFHSVHLYYILFSDKFIMDKVLVLIAPIIHYFERFRYLMVYHLKKLANSKSLTMIKTIMHIKEYRHEHINQLYIENIKKTN